MKFTETEVFAALGVATLQRDKLSDRVAQLERANSEMAAQLQAMLDEQADPDADKDNDPTAYGYEPED